MSQTSRPVPNVSAFNVLPQSPSHSDHTSQVPLTSRISEIFHEFTGGEIVLNRSFFQELTGRLMLVELILGSLIFVMLTVACDSYFDPWLERPLAGFAGGKAETFLLLTCFHALMLTLAVVAYIFLAKNGTNQLMKSNFLFGLNFMQFLLYMMASVICFQEVSSRNYGTIRFERNFWTKTFASVFALVNTVIYFLTTIYTCQCSSSNT